MEKVVVFRHGASLYRYGEKWPKDSELDLTQEGAETVLRKATMATCCFPAEARPKIYVSPVKRCLDTGGLISAVFGGSEIELREELREVANFDWQYLRILVFGGQAILPSGEKVEVSVQDSNPHGFGVDHFFFFELYARIPENILGKWPAEYREIIAKIERASAVRQRMRGFLAGLLSQPAEASCLAVTHDALCGFLVGIYTGGQKLSLEPGRFIVLERSGDDYQVSYVEGLPENGRSLVLANS